MSRDPPKRRHEWSKPARRQGERLRSRRVATGSFFVKRPGGPSEKRTKSTFATTITSMTGAASAFEGVAAATPSINQETSSSRS